jgi:hypothetical protein
MILKDLILKYKWKEVEEEFIRLYPEEIKNIIGYKNVFKSLKRRKPKESDMEIYINFIDGKEFDEEQWYDVFGKDGQIDTHTQQEASFALEFSPFNSWIGYKISDKLKKEMSEINIICHCLWEMTFNGFTTKQLIQNIKKIT